MGRVAIYARETPGRAGRARLDRQIERLVAQVAHQPGWRHVATYADQSLGRDRPGLVRMLVEAPGRIDLVVIDGYGRLSASRHEQQLLVAQLHAAGVQTIVVPPTAGRRLARFVANMALADLVREAAH